MNFVFVYACGLSLGLLLGLGFAILLWAIDIVYCACMLPWNFACCILVYRLEYDLCCFDLFCVLFCGLELCFSFSCLVIVLVLLVWCFVFVCLDVLTAWFVRISLGLCICLVFIAFWYCVCLWKLFLCWLLDCLQVCLVFTLLVDKVCLGLAYWFVCLVIWFCRDVC